MTDYTDLISQMSLDFVKAAPAAIARIMLGWKAEPAIGAFASAAQKCCAIIGSISLAIMAGDLARSFPSTSGIAGLVVIATAFNAQHISNRLIVFSKPLLRTAEKHVKKRIHSDDN